ncbi:MAG: hypothetical protein LDL07_02700 [Desulfarculus sp.]|nr:hypothetical protein [Desulfarculus sp.]
MKAEDVGRLQDLSGGLPGLCQSWLVMREALADILSCALSQEMGQAQRLAFITNLARSAGEAADRA